MSQQDCVGQCWKTGLRAARGGGGGVEPKLTCDSHCYTVLAMVPDAVLTMLRVVNCTATKVFRQASAVHRMSGGRSSDIKPGFAALVCCYDLYFT